MPKSLNQKGFSVIEVILAAAVFTFIASGIVVVILQGLNSNRRAKEQITAYQYASEGLEAIRSIKNQGFSNLGGTTGPGVVLAGGTWGFSPDLNTFGKYTRGITISNVYRDGSGNVVETGGTLDSMSKLIKSVTTWPFNSSQDNTISLTSYLTNWKMPMGRKGLLVYGNGGTTSDAIQYKVFNSNDGTWTAGASAADVDSATTNKYLRAVKVYSSPTKNEKIIISRHYNGSSQFIYAQVYNGTSWGNVVLLSSWAATTYLDVRNFGGAYMSNGNFMAVYSDNTTTPKMRVWNGSSWAAASNLPTITAAPVYIIVKARPGTNEVMAAFYSTNRYTTTAYYSGSSWTLHAVHSTTAVIATKKMVDFEWSLGNPTIGALVYSNSTSDRRTNIRIFTADGAGSGSWNTTAESPNQSSNLGVLNVAANPATGEFNVCNKNAATTPTIVCFESDLSGSWGTPTNSTVSTATNSGIQQSYDVEYENASGDQAIAVYSDNTTSPKVKRYTTSNTTWDSAATAISTGSYTLGAVVTARTIPLPTSDDIMVLIGDGNLDVYSVMWDGQNDSMYTSADGKAFTRHGTSGSATTDYWYDFAWDLN